MDAGVTITGQAGSSGGVVLSKDFVVMGGPAGKLPTPPRPAKTKQLVPVAPLETIRHRLGLSMEAMSEAIGYSANTYATYVRDGRAPRTAALAVEALSRRQAAADTVFLVRVVKGVPVVTMVVDVETATIAGKCYLLVPDAR